MLIGVDVSCRILHFIASYLYVSYSGSITSVGEESYFCSKRFPLPLGAWGGLRNFNLLLPGPSI